MTLHDQLNEYVDYLKMRHESAQHDQLVALHDLQRHTRIAIESVQAGHQLDVGWIKQATQKAADANLEREATAQQVVTLTKFMDDTTL